MLLGPSVVAVFLLIDLIGARSNAPFLVAHSSLRSSRSAGMGCLGRDRSTDRHVRFVWQLRRTPERDCSELDGRARAYLDKPAAPAYVGSCSRRKRASSCPSHSRRSADETSTTAVHGRDQVQPQTCQQQNACSGPC